MDALQSERNALFVAKLWVQAEAYVPQRQNFSQAVKYLMVCLEGIYPLQTDALSVPTLHSSNHRGASHTIPNSRDSFRSRTRYLAVQNSTGFDFEGKEKHQSQINQRRCT